MRESDHNIVRVGSRLEFQKAKVVVIEVLVRIHNISGASLVTTCCHDRVELRRR